MIVINVIGLNLNNCISRNEYGDNIYFFMDETKMEKLIIVILLGTCSLSVHAKVTVADVDRDSAWFASQNTTTSSCVSADGTHLTDNCSIGVPPTENSTINWDSMPAGTRCGNYVMSGGATRSLTLCQGHNPRYSCPSGFSREDFGYFEAGGGPRQYNWCSKL